MQREFDGKRLPYPGNDLCGEQRMAAEFEEVVFDANLSLLYRIDDAWRIRLGYNAIWLTGVALAPSQFDFSTSTTAGTGLVGGRTLWLNGMNLGLERRW